MNELREKIALPGKILYTNIILIKTLLPSKVLHIF